MQTAVLPVTTCDEIDRRIRNFVWGSTEEERKVCLVAWDKVCIPKEKGGLGLRLARQLNRAFLTKLAFTFLKEKDKLWVQVLEHKYFRQSEVGLVRRNLRSLSSLWKGLTHEWETMLAGSRSAIRDGTDTLFWSDKWVDADIRLIDYADTAAAEFDLSCTVASMVNTEGQWDYPRLERLFTPDAVDIVAGMTPPQASRGADDWVWGLENSGSFSIKSAYNLICQTNSMSDSILSKAVWRWNGPGRIKHFLWLATMDKLLTNDARRRRGLCADGSCCWCGTTDETSLHVLQDCTFAKSVWLKVGGFACDGADWNNEAVDWFQRFLGGDKELRFGIVCWYLWRARNERLFAGSLEKESSVASRCLNWESKVQGALNFESCFLGSARKEQLIQVAWKAGPQGWLTLGTCSITRAELRGALEGIRLAWSTGFKKVEVQIDSLAAIAILLDKNPVINHHHAIEVFEFRDWVRKDWEIKLKHVYREGNQVADFLARLGHKLPRGCHSVPLSDCNLAYHVRLDCMGISEPRLVN
ncbi:Putative ribonuclease H protein At1g65750 [Linum perenne]